MIIADLAKIEGRTYPARRRTQNLVGGASPVRVKSFCMGYVTLDPDGGQVPWHNQPQEEVYFVLEGTGEMCLGEEKQTLPAEIVRMEHAHGAPHRHLHFRFRAMTPDAEQMLRRVIAVRQRALRRA